MGKTPPSFYPPLFGSAKLKFYSCLLRDQGQTEIGHNLKGHYKNVVRVLFKAAHSILAVEAKINSNRRFDW